MHSSSTQHIQVYLDKDTSKSLNPGFVEPQAKWLSLFFSLSWLCSYTGSTPCAFRHPSRLGPALHCPSLETPTSSKGTCPKDSTISTASTGTHLGCSSAGTELWSLVISIWLKMPWPRRNFLLALWPVLLGPTEENLTCPDTMGCQELPSVRWPRGRYGHWLVLFFLWRILAQIRSRGKNVHSNIAVSV